MSYEIDGHNDKTSRIVIKSNTTMWLSYIIKDNQWYIQEKSNILFF